MASKLSPQQADGFFYQSDMKIREKGKFFVNRSVPENFQWENFLGQVPTESLRTQDSENVYERWVQQIFDRVLAARSWEMPVKRELPAKIGRCSKSWAVTILTLERNPPERKLLYMLKIFSQEDFALKSKLRPGGFLQHLPR